MKEEDRIRKIEEDHMKMLTPQSLIPKTPQPAYLWADRRIRGLTRVGASQRLRSGSESPRKELLEVLIQLQKCAGSSLYLLRELMIERETQGPVLPACQSSGEIGPVVGLPRRG